MAFLDDRLWCHPKWADLSDAAWRTGVSSILYSHGFLTEGRLTAGQLRQIGTSKRERDELIAAGVWELNGDGVHIHDYGDYNIDGERIRRRRAQTRDRVKRYRERQAQRATERYDEADRNALPDGDGDADVTRDLARARGSEDLRSEKDPLTPAERGPVTQARTANPRALGTNPRAIADRQRDEQRDERHAALIAAAVKAADDWGPASTDILHDRLDELEQEHGSRFTDQERGRVVDHAVARWAP